LYLMSISNSSSGKCFFSMLLPPSDIITLFLSYVFQFCRQKVPTHFVLFWLVFFSLYFLGKTVILRKKPWVSIKFSLIIPLKVSIANWFTLSKHYSVSCHQKVFSKHLI
jgi:hypothetical protein